MQVSAEHGADYVECGLPPGQFPAVTEAEHNVPPEIGGQDGDQDQHGERAGLLAEVDGSPEDRDEEGGYQALAL